MTKPEAIAMLDKWTRQPMIRRLVPEVVRAVRLIIGRKALPVGVSKVPLKGWRELD